MGLLLLFPTGDNDLPEAEIPGVGAVSLSGGKFSLFGLVKTQLVLGPALGPAAGLGGRTSLVMEPRANPLIRDINGRSVVQRYEIVTRTLLFSLLNANSAVPRGSKESVESGGGVNFHLWYQPS